MRSDTPPIVGDELDIVETSPTQEELTKLEENCPAIWNNGLSFKSNPHKEAEIRKKGIDKFKKDLETAGHTPQQLERILKDLSEII